MNEKHFCSQCSAPILKINPKTKNHFCGVKCYGLWQKGSSFSQQGKKLRHKKLCSISDCKELHFGKGFCRKHYMSLYYRGLPKTKTRHTKKDETRCSYCDKAFIARHKGARFCSISCASTSKRRAFIIKRGYKKVLLPSHPRADKKGYVFEHIVVLEAFIGRAIIHPEEVHHKDFNKMNNALENLVLCQNHAEHMKHHARLPSGVNEK